MAKKKAAPSLIIVDLFRADGSLARKGIRFMDTPEATAVEQAREFAEHHKAAGRKVTARTR